MSERKIVTVEQVVEVFNPVVEAFKRAAVALADVFQRLAPTIARICALLGITNPTPQTAKSIIESRNPKISRKYKRQVIASMVSG